MRSPFDRQLNVELHKYKAETGTPLYKIAEKADIDRNRLYNFSSAVGRLNSEEIYRLMNVLNVDLIFRSKDD